MIYFDSFYFCVIDVLEQIAGEETVNSLLESTYIGLEIFHFFMEDIACFDTAVLLLNNL